MTKKLTKTQNAILGALTDATAPMTSAELAEIVGVTKTTARNNAEKLVRNYDRKAREYVEGPLAHGPSRKGSYTYCLRENVEALKAAAEDAEAKRIAQEAKEAGLVECQVCEGHFCEDKHGALWNHGYKRPGWGFLLGGCMGVGHKPFPETNALEAYLPRVQARIETIAKLLADQDNWQAITYQERDYDAWNRWGQRKMIDKTVNRPTAEDDIEREAAWSLYCSFDNRDALTDAQKAERETARDTWRKLHDVREKFEREHRARVYRLESERKELVREVERVTARIEKGRALRAEAVAQ